MKHSLRMKFVISGSCLILFCLCMLFGISRALKNEITEQWNRSRMHAIADEVYEKLESSNWEWLTEEAAEYAFDNSISIEIEDEDINTILNTKLFQNTKKNVKINKLLKKYQQELREKGEVFISYFRENNRVSFVHIKHVEGKGYITILKSITGLNSSMKVMEICFLFSAGITLVIGIMGIIYLSGRMLKPINELNRITGKIARFEFEEKMNVTGNDELSLLATSVNQMSDCLKDNMDNLQKDVELRENLMRNLSHELRTPIAVIMGYAENMPYIVKDYPDKIERYCHVITNECERMNGMVGQMLEAFSEKWGKESLKKEYFTPEKLLQNLKECFQDEKGTWKGEFLVECDMQEPIYGDYEAINRAVYNFIKNAVKYGKADGIIRVKIYKENDMVYFSVFNEGSHIPESEKEKIWNIFYKINKARTRESDSYGIGLSIVLQIALAHDGKAYVENVNKGVNFVMAIKNK